MKLISWLAIAALCITAYGASSRVASDGAQYNFGDWSPPQQIDLPSTDVPIPVLRRSMIVERIALQQPSRYSIDLVSAMNSRSVWIGIPFDHYFAIGERDLWCSDKWQVAFDQTFEAGRGGSRRYPGTCCNKRDH